MTTLYDTRDLMPSSFATGGPEATWGDLWQAEIERMRLVENVNARSVALERAYDQRIDAIFNATGQRLDNPMRMMGGVAATRGGVSTDDILGGFDARLKEMERAHPELRDVIRAGTSVQDDAYRLARQAEGQAENVAERAPPGWASTIVQFGAALRGSLEDPAQILAMGLATGPAGPGARGLLWAGVKNAVANGGAEAALQPFVQDWRRKAGLDYGADRALASVGLAAAGGFALDAVPRGLYRGVQSARGRVPIVQNNVVTGYRVPDSPAEALEEAARASHPENPLAKAAAGDVEAAAVVARQTGAEADPAVRGTLQEIERARVFGPPPEIDDGSHAQSLADAVRAALDPEALPPAAPVLTERQSAMAAPQADAVAKAATAAPARDYPKLDAQAERPVAFVTKAGDRYTFAASDSFRTAVPDRWQTDVKDAKGKLSVVRYLSPEDAFALRRHLDRDGKLKNGRRMYDPKQANDKERFYSDSIFIDQPRPKSLVEFKAAVEARPGLVPVLRTSKGFEILDEIESLVSASEVVAGKPIGFVTVPKGAVKDAQAFQNVKGGSSIAFERADGQVVLLRQASRQAERGGDPRAFVMREKDGWSIEDARAIAARKSLEEASGSAVDMAVLLRRRPDLADRTLPLSDYKFQQAVGLAKLSDPAFERVLAGALPPNYAALVGRHVVDAGLHAGLVDGMARAGVKSERAAKTWLGQALAGPVTAETHQVRLGNAAPAGDVMVERVAALTEALKMLEKSKRLFAVLEKDSLVIRQAGNVLDEVANRERAFMARKVAGVVETMARQPGRINDLLQEAAYEIAAGVKPKDAARTFVDKVTGILEREGVQGLSKKTGAAVAETELTPIKMSDPFGPEAKAQAEGLKAEAEARAMEAQALEAQAEALWADVQYVRELQRMPKPTRLLAWLKARGGIWDRTGDVRHIIGGVKGYPGLIRGGRDVKGQVGMPGLGRHGGPEGAMTLDDAAMRAWEEGYIQGTDRPTANDLLDLIARDMNDDTPVVHYQDYEILQELETLGERQRYLNEQGVDTARSLDEIKAVLGRRAQEDRRASGAGPRSEEALPEGGTGQKQRAPDQQAELDAKRADELGNIISHCKPRTP